MNSIAVVFREPEVLSFYEYINHKAENMCFYSYNCSYIGIQQNSENLSSDTSDEEDEEMLEETSLSSENERTDNENEEFTGKL